MRFIYTTLPQYLSLFGVCQYITYICPPKTKNYETHQSAQPINTSSKQYYSPTLFSFNHVRHTQRLRLSCHQPNPPARPYPCSPTAQHHYPHLQTVPAHRALLPVHIPTPLRQLEPGTRPGRPPARPRHQHTTFPSPQQHCIPMEHPRPTTHPVRSHPATL